MTNNLNKPFYYTFLLAGLLMFPFLSFSQQQEEPKRVTVVVIAKEVAPQKEIVQLPADNLPKIVSSKPRIRAIKATIIPTVKKSASSSPKIATVPKAAPKENMVATRNPKASKTPPVAKTTVAKPVIPVKKEPIPVKKTEVVQVKPPIKQEQKPEKPVEAKTSRPIAKTTTTVPNASVSKDAKQTGEEAVTSAELKAGSNEVVKLTHNSKVNSFSYIWIGIFLIVAGLVLGLLFGKPAFLISFVGIVFITLGLVI